MSTCILNFEKEILPAVNTICNIISSNNHFDIDCVRQRFINIMLSHRKELPEEFGTLDFNSTDLRRARTRILLAVLLFNGNVKSFNYCYGENEEYLSIESASEICRKAEFYERKNYTEPLEYFKILPKVLKFLACLEYQSCEVKNYEYTLQNKLITILEKSLKVCMPGYEEAAWGWEN